MSIDRGMDKEDVVHIYNGTLLSHKEQNNVICSSIDGSRDCDIEWCMLEREIQISYDIIYMWNLIKMIQKNLFNRNKLTDFKTSLMLPQGNHGVGRELLGWEYHIHNNIQKYMGDIINSLL